jgi:alpha-tubulin suppressor-like RCC1 family protein
LRGHAVLILLAAGLCVLMPASQAALAASGGVTSISAGDASSCAIESGQAYCWGVGFAGVPAAVLGGKALTQIAADDATACALDSAGAAYCWGDNDYGEFGDGSFTSSSVPVAVDTSGVLAGKTLTKISAAFNTACVLDSAGAAYCWGRSDQGQLGDGSTVNSSVPVAVDTGGALAGKTLTQISVGMYGDVCALDSAGAAYCWGGSSRSTVPVALDTSGVPAGKTLTQISAGGGNTCALDSAGAAYCWGSDAQGPVAVDTSGVLAGKTLTQISAGNLHTCALDSAGAAYCWGDNHCGELGEGDAIDDGYYCPTYPQDARNCEIGKSCAEPSGQTGSDGAPIDRGLDGPGRVLTNQSFTQISAGLFHTCAVTGTGAIYCWGDNVYGELGDDSSSLISDVPVLAGPQAPAAVAAMPRDASAAVSWTAPGSLDGGTLRGYTATASPGGETCTTTKATTCTVTGLTNGTTYTITVADHTTAGESGASAAATVTPEPATGPIVSGYHKTKCIDDSGDASTNDTAIVISDCNDSLEQNWTVKPGGTIQINGKCMDIYRDEKTNKAPVELWACTGGANQQWHATAGTLVNPVSGKCLDDPRFNTADGTQLEIYTCNGGDNQKWNLP